MDKNQKQLLMLGGLILVFLVVSINSVITVRKKIAKARKSGQVKPKEFSRPTVATTSTQTQSPTDTESLSGQFSWGADPFSGRRIDVGAGGGPALTVTGIVYNSKKPEDSYAIIDNSIVKIGDKITGSQMEVTEITRDTVTLTDEKDKLELKVW